MKKLLLSLILLSSIAFASIPIEVIKILDGDTIKVKIETGNKFDIRLKGIDCYETSKIHRAYHQAYDDNLTIDEVINKGNVATEYLKTLYSKAKTTSFDFMGVDKYGRVLGIIYFDKLNVNNELKTKGICKPYEFKEK